jgi:hypothetical protein
MQAGPGATADADSDQAAAAGSGSSEGLDPEELRRREVLARLQGRESQLESGLKVGCCSDKDTCCCCCLC